MSCFESVSQKLFWLPCLHAALNLNMASCSAVLTAIYNACCSLKSLGYGSLHPSAPPQRKERWMGVFAPPNSTKGQALTHFNQICITATITHANEKPYLAHKIQNRSNDFSRASLACKTEGRRERMSQTDAKPPYHKENGTCGKMGGRRSSLKAHG